MRRLSLEGAVSLGQVASAFVMVFTLLYAVSEWKRTVDYTTQDLENYLGQRFLEMVLLLADPNSDGPRTFITTPRLSSSTSILV